MDTSRRTLINTPHAAILEFESLPKNRQSFEIIFYPELIYLRENSLTLSPTILKIFFRLRFGIIISLFAHPDGSPPAGKVLDGIFNGDLTKAAISGFKNVDGFTAGPSIIADDADKAFAFAGSVEGVDYHVYADSFVKGSVFGVIVYAVPTSLPDPDYLVLAAVLGGEGAKLP